MTHLRRLTLATFGQIMAVCGVALIAIAAFSDTRHVLHIFNVHQRSGVAFYAGVVLDVAGFGLQLFDGLRQPRIPRRSTVAFPVAETARDAPAFTGGIWIDMPPFGRFSATWPFAHLVIGEQALRISIDFTGRFSKVFFHFYLLGKLFQWNRTYELPYDTIDRVTRQRAFCSSGVRIRHHADAPTFILFFSRKWQDILRELANRGVTVEPAP